MKSIVSSIVILLLNCTISMAQNPTFDKAVASPDAIIKTLYKVISGEKGEARNWTLFHHLFHKDAKLIPTGKTQDGKTMARFMTPEGYQNTSGKWLVENGFYEKEIGRTTETYGAITHVFSSYESFRSKNDTKPFMRGINSIQLLNDGTRWWILNVYWFAETKEHPIPKKYLN